MPYREVTEKLAAYRRDIAALRDKMRVLQKEAEPEEVENGAPSNGASDGDALAQIEIGPEALSRR